MPHPFLFINIPPIATSIIDRMACVTPRRRYQKHDRHCKCTGIAVQSRPIETRSNY